MEAKLQDASKVRARRGCREPALINKNGLIEMGVYLVEFPLTPAKPKDGVWRMKAIQAAGYWFAENDRDCCDAPFTVEECGFRVVKHLKRSRLHLGNIQAPPQSGGRMVGGRGGAYCDRPKCAAPSDAGEARQSESRRNA